MNRALLGLTAAAACVIGALAEARQQQPRDQPSPVVAGTAVISGVVTTDERSPQPARKARVTLNAVDRSVPGRTETTDDAGRFTFRAVPAGRFTLDVTKPGYLKMSYGARRPERNGTPLAVSAGQQI